MGKIRVLVADDSALMRQTLKRIIDAEPGMELAGVARDGEDAVTKARELKPDVLTLDINMPKLDGISALQIILGEKICPVVMVSSLTQRGAVTTFECLELGAFDFVAKPDGTVSVQMGAVAAELVSKVKAAATAGVLDRVRRGRAQRAALRPRTISAPPSGRSSPTAVAMGISTGGPATLMNILPLLPNDLAASLFLVQHMPASFLAAFARRLDENCAIKVVEAGAGMVVEPGTCYVAPGGLQLCPYRKSSGAIVIRTPAQPETLFMPSVSVMMAAVLQAYGRNTVGVLMTGIGDDGASQMVAIREAGGRTIAESAETAVVYGMPREAVERGGAEVVAPSYQIAGEIVDALGKGWLKPMIELEEYLKRLAGADEGERIYAAEDIGYANLADGVPPLLARLAEEPSRAVREAIFGALERIEDDTVTEGAIGLLAGEDSFVRNQAVELLRKRGPRVIPFLRRAFQEAGKDQRKMLVDVLAAVDGPGSSEIYDLALSDRDMNVVITAVESLGNAGKTEFRERVEELAGARNPMLAGASLETLARIGNARSLDVIRSRTGPAGAVADFLLPSYLKLLAAHGDEQAVAEAAGMLDSRGAHLQASILDAITILRQRRPATPLPESLVEPLTNIVRHGNSLLLRRQALRLLGGLAQFDGVPALLEEYRETETDCATGEENFGV